MNTAIYLRVSTDEQATNGYGLDAQRAKCRAMAEIKGWEIAGEYVDEGISGTKDEAARPGLAALLDDTCSGRVGSVIVSSLDRLGRSTRLVLRLVDRLDGCKAELVSCKESLDTSTPAGRFVLRMFASLAELERDTIIQRTTDGRNERGKIDGEKGGRLPMGYVRTEGGIEIDPARASVVRSIFTQRAAGATLAAIAGSLNEQGISTPRGGSWHPSSVREVLQNEPKYRGGRRGESDTAWPPIL